MEMSSGDNTNFLSQQIHGSVPLGMASSARATAISRLSKVSLWAKSASFAFLPLGSQISPISRFGPWSDTPSSAPIRLQVAVQYRPLKKRRLDGFYSAHD